MVIHVGNALTKPIPYVGVSVMQIVWFTVFLVVGVVIVRVLARIFERAMGKAGAPPLVVSMASSMIRVIGYVVVLLAVLPTLGISTSAAGLGLSAILAFIIGFGLQDTWANMAAGVWLAVIRPFDIGDFINTAGHTGVVQGIGVMSTILKAPDNTVIIIPNRSIWGSPITNYTREPIRRASIIIGVAYGTDLSKAIETALNTVRGHPDVLDDPAPQVIVSELADSSVNLEVRVWTAKENYAKVQSDLKKMLYEEYGRAGIEIPYPQLDVHVRDTPECKAA